MSTVEEFQDRFAFLLSQKIRTAIVDSRYVKHPFKTGWLRAHWVVVRLSNGQWAPGNNVEYGPPVEARTDFVFIAVSHANEMIQEVMSDMGKPT